MADLRKRDISRRSAELQTPSAEPFSSSAKSGPGDSAEAQTFLLKAQRTSATTADRHSAECAENAEGVARLARAAEQWAARRAATAADRAERAERRHHGLRSRYEQKTSHMPEEPPVAAEPSCATTGARLSAMSTKDGKERTRNKYAGYCQLCGRHVPAGAGCVGRSRERWVIYC